MGRLRLSQDNLDRNLTEALRYRVTVALARQGQALAVPSAEVCLAHQRAGNHKELVLAAQVGAVHLYRPVAEALAVPRPGAAAAQMAPV